MPDCETAAIGFAGALISAIIPLANRPADPGFPVLLPAVGRILKPSCTTPRCGPSPGGPREVRWRRGKTWRSIDGKKAIRGVHSALDCCPPSLTKVWFKRQDLLAVTALKHPATERS